MEAFKKKMRQAVTGDENRKIHHWIQGKGASEESDSAGLLAGASSAGGSSGGAGAGSVAGAYLVFGVQDNGVLSIVWSETKVDGALAYGTPKKTVPAFKYSKDGKTTLKENIQKDKALYYAGWCMFVKECGQFNSSIIVLGSSGPMPTTLWLHYGKNNVVKKVQPNEAFTLDGVDSIAAVHSDSQELNVPSMERRLFVQKAQLAGYCVGLSQGTTCCFPG